MATDDEKIYEEVKNGFKPIMSSELALTGTDRVAEVVDKLNYDIYINVQGDEPLINPNDVINCAKLKQQYPNRIINGYTFITNNENPLNVTFLK